MRSGQTGVEGEKCAIGEREKGEMLQQDTNKDS